MPNAALKEIYFDFDKSNVRPGDAKILDASATYLKSNPNQLVLIEGHCDERGTIEYNLALGERRAKAAMNYLVAQGIDASRFTLISYGKERPVCTEKTEACWAKNRFDGSSPSPGSCPRLEGVRTGPPPASATAQLTRRRLPEQIAKRGDSVLGPATRCKFCTSAV